MRRLEPRSLGNVKAPARKSPPDVQKGRKTLKNSEWPKESGSDGFVRCRWRLSAWNKATSGETSRGLVDPPQTPCSRHAAISAA